MRFYSETLGLSDAAFALLRDLVQERTGIHYDNSKSVLLAEKLSPLVIERGLDSFLDYYYLLKYDENAAAEWQRVMDALSVPETYFWREMDPVRALVQHIVPQHFAGHPGIPFRIWSAACASGEEPLTLAMALDLEGWFERAPIHIVASDASVAAIDKARRGIYRERSFRALPVELRTRYFRQEGSEWQVAPELQARIQWQVANLVVESDVAPLACVSAIFCRNVFIYFSQDATRKTVAQFYRHLKTPGYLFVGASESLLRLNMDFKLEEIGNAFVYVKH